MSGRVWQVAEKASNLNLEVKTQNSEVQELAEFGFAF
jgi:hypothetical protein